MSKKFSKENGMRSAYCELKFLPQNQQFRLSGKISFFYLKKKSHPMQ